MSMAKQPLTVELLCTEATAFAAIQAQTPRPDMYLRTIPKGVGTAMEKEFRAHLQANYNFVPGHSSKGVDFPGIGVDVKATLITRPQSSCRFTSVDQKVYGLGYDLLVFLYRKRDDKDQKTAFLKIEKTVFVCKKQTGDHTLTRILLADLQTGANKEDLISTMRSKYLALTDEEADKLGDRLLREPPLQGYIGISPAQQWRLRYRKAAEYAGQVEGVLDLTK